MYIKVVSCKTLSVLLQFSCSKSKSPVGKPWHTFDLHTVLRIIGTKKAKNGGAQALLCKLQQYINLEDLTAPRGLCFSHDREIFFNLCSVLLQRRTIFLTGERYTGLKRRSKLQLVGFPRVSVFTVFW